MTHSADALASAAGDRIPPGHIVVALSGGADSAVAAWLSVQVADAQHVRAVHVNHAQPASGKLQIAAESIAAALGITCVTVPVTVGTGASFENQARLARLGAVEAEALDGEWIVTGHQADDVAETVIGNLARGAGARGLAGIASARDRYVRPLIEIERTTVRTVAHELALPFVDDPSNDDPAYQRNRIRHDLIPAMEAALGKGLIARIGRAAAHLAEDDARLESEAASIALVAGYRGAVLLPAATLVVSPRPVAARAVRRALRLARPPYPGSSDEVAKVIDVALGSAERTSLAADFLVQREGPHVVIYRPEDHEPLQPHPLSVPGAADFGPVRVVAFAGPATVVGRTAVLVRVEPEGLVVRAAADGEKIDIGVGSKLVRDAMAEAGIPLRLRRDWPLVAQHGRIVWIAGGRIAAFAGHDDHAHPPLLLKMERLAL